MILKKNNIYKHMFLKFFIILFYFFSNPSVFQWPPYIIRNKKTKSMVSVSGMYSSLSAA